MRVRAYILPFALATTLALAGCGEDNGGNDNDGGVSPTATATPGPQPTATAPPATQTPGGSPTESPTGDGSPTPQPTGNGVCEGEALSVTVTSTSGSDLDTGFTGIAHNNEAIDEASVTTNLDCPGLQTCTVDGANLVGTNFGSPLPLSSGGVPVCVINTFREPVTGTYNCSEGSAESDVKITSFVFLVQDIAKPCPLCVGDPTPNDGQQGGTCDSDSTTPGAACDTGGISPDFGPTSNDCLPTGSSVGELEIDLNPLTTGTVSVDSSIDCASPFFPPGSCYCPGQISPNSCTDGVCTDGTCLSGPIDGLCSNQNFRSCRPGSGTADCEDVTPGAGTCVERNRPCFTDNITRTGVPGTQEGVLVSFFCIPATRAPAINTTAGLPGPGALSLPARQVRVPR